MHSKFKKGEIVIVYGKGEIDGKVYRNKIAKVIERDPYYKDYLVRFEDGTEDWLLPKHIQKLTERNK